MGRRGTRDRRATATSDAFLDATHAWAVEQVRRLHATDPAARRTDSKAESWTMAKVLRRLVYHTLDHVGELERRLGV